MVGVVGHGGRVVGVVGQNRARRLGADCRGVGAECGRRGEGSRGIAVDAPGHAGLQEPAARVFDVHAARDELVESREVRPVADVRHRETQQCRVLDDLGRGARGGVAADEGADDLGVLDAAAHGGELGIFGERRLADQQAEVLPLLAREDAETDVAIDGDLYGGDLEAWLDVVAAAHRAPKCLHVRARGSDSFEERQVDVVASAGCSGSP